MFPKPIPVKQSHIELFPAFDCGVSVFNNWLTQRAYENQLSGASFTYLVIIDGAIAGYFSLNNYSIMHASLSRSFKHGLPDPIPAVLLGRLAVDKRFQRQGLFTFMLAHALKISVELSQKIGIVAVAVHPFTEAVANKYLDYGFRMAKKNEWSLLLFKLRDANGLLTDLH